MGLTVRKLLEVYFEKWQLQNVLERIDEPVSGNVDELVNRILQEWEPHRKNKYDLLGFLERSALSRICVAYGLDHHGNKGALIKKIKKSRLLDADFINISNNDSHRSEKRNETSKNLSTKKIIAIITGVLITIAGIGGGAYYFTISINQQNTGNIVVTDSENVQVIINQGNVNTGFGEISISEPSTISCTIDGEIGKTYCSKTLGFHITRPNSHWHFNENLGAIKEESTGTPPEKYFLGGIYVNSDSQENVFVAVFDSVALKNETLEEYVERQISYNKEEFNAEEKLRKFSPDKKWAIFGLEATYLNDVLYGVQILEIKNDKLYMLQYTGRSPETISLDKKEELRFVFDSFTPF